MAPRPTPNLLSVILPTYNEAENLPIVIWLLVHELQKRRARTHHTHAHTLRRAKTSLSRVFHSVVRAG
jgi:hypothetical protein